MDSKIAVVGGGMSGLLAAHASNYSALVLEARPKPNTAFGDMLGARFIHDAPELRELFGFEGDPALCTVSADTTSTEKGLAQYVAKTRQCTLADIPSVERESVMNWGQGTFPFLPVDVNAWAQEAERKAGVVYGAKVIGISRDNSNTHLHLDNGRAIAANRILFTLPLPVMLKIAGISGFNQLRSFPTTVGRFACNDLGGEQLPTTMHYVTNPALSVTRVTTRGTLVVVEASARQAPDLLSLMGQMANERLHALGYSSHPIALGFSTFSHHFAYHENFLSDRELALKALEQMGLYALGRYAQYSHRIKTLETYRRAKELVS